MDCHFLHPRSWTGRCSENECPAGAECLFSDCPNSHPHRPSPCTYGANCLRGKDECRYIHPQSWYSQEVVRENCQHGEACSREDCRFAHPPSRVICRDGGNCRYTDCSATAHPKRRQACRNGSNCSNEECHFLHPQSWYGEHCPFGKRCLYSDCEKKHPARPTVCRDGMKCSRAKQACSHLHPREWYGESKLFVVDPSKIRFTHGHIHHKFRSGNGIDETIDRCRSGEITFDDFPPTEVFRLTRAILEDDSVIESILSSLDITAGSPTASKFIKQLRESCTGELFSLSNRRLYVARVSRNFGLLDKVCVQEYDFASERVQRPERGEEEGDEKAKWLSALSTENMGRSVHCHSTYRGFEVHGYVAHTFKLPHAVTEESGTMLRRQLRGKIQEKIDHEKLSSRLHTLDEPYDAIDVCVPQSSLPTVEQMTVPNLPQRKPKHIPKAKLAKDQVFEFLSAQQKGGKKGRGKGKRP